MGCTRDNLDEPINIVDKKHTLVDISTRILIYTFQSLLMDGLWHVATHFC